jgi:arylsulfatase A-like enzyme
MNDLGQGLPARRAVLALLLLLSTATCTSRDDARVLTAEMPLHLEDHLDAATFTTLAATNGPTVNGPQPVEWRFDQPQPEWKASPMWNPGYRPAALARTADSLRVTFTQWTRFPNGRPAAGIHVDVPDWDRRDWAEVVIRLRAAPGTPAFGLMLGFNAREGPGTTVRPLEPFEFQSEGVGSVPPDSAVQTYRIPVNSGQAAQAMKGPWRQLGLWFFQWSTPWARTADSVEILSVIAVPKGAVPVPTTVEWQFDEPQPDWKPIPLRSTANAAVTAAAVERTSDALRVTLPEDSRDTDNALHGGIYVDLPGWRREEWAHLIVRARTTSVTNMRIWLNPGSAVARRPFTINGGSTPIVSDGSVHTYEVRPEWGTARAGRWSRVGLEFSASEPGAIDILSVSVVPIAVLYAGDGRGSRTIAAGRTSRRSIFTHAPGRLEYRVRAPEGGRLQVALGVLSTPVEFRVTAQAATGEATTLLQETHADPAAWAARTVDLSTFAGQTITLGLEATAATADAIGFWGSPTVSGPQRPAKPNVILYVIDGGWADDMSVYGYNRRTTPNLERLAAQGAVFEHAYSNSSWTKPSTASFMTSLHASVLGFTGERYDRVPDEAVTMAERFHRAGYQTAVFTANPNAATVSGLEQWADLIHEPPVQNDILSSVKLHDAFWDWRADSSGQPYWAHFQPTDVHAYEGRNAATALPFSGTFVTTQRRREFFAEWDGFNRNGGGPWIAGLAAAGVDRIGFFETMRALYDESLAHQDHQIGRLVERLREQGEWENSLLIIAGDHAIAAALRDLGTLIQGSPPPDWNRAMLRSSVTRVPMIFVWPARIAGGQRFEAPVSMIDLLPTVLDLTGLPLPDVMQGQSLAPLLLGEAGWTRRPVILEEVATEPGQPRRGTIEVIDGRWGASLQIGPEAPDPKARRPWPLLLYDVWADPLALRPVNEVHPDLVDKYTKFLLDQWKDHQALAKQFTPGPKVALTPEQLERLRSLGYIR